MGRLALLFPGQGSQYVGMGADLRRASAAASAAYAEADDVLGSRISDLCEHGPEDELRQTQNTQPALFVTSCAALAALRERCSPVIRGVAGHSVGEYAALFAVGAIGFAEGLRLVALRARLMQKRAEERPGSMSAVIGLPPEMIAEACHESRSAGVVAVANYNCPGQTVISGERSAVVRAGDRCKELGAKAVMPLAVSGGFHSPLMSAAGDSLYPALRSAGFRPTEIPVVMNVNADYCRNGGDIAPFLTMQVSSAVRWEDSMRRLLADGVDRFIELGAGTVLAGLMKRIDRSVSVVSVGDAASLDRAVDLANTADEA